MKYQEYNIINISIQTIKMFYKFHHNGIGHVRNIDAINQIEYTGWLHICHFPYLYAHTYRNTHTHTHPDI